MPRKNWKSVRQRKFANSAARTNKEILEKTVPRGKVPVFEIIGDIRSGLDPPDLISHINWLAKVGNKRHIPVLDWILRRHPERESDPYPYYSEIREAALRAKKKLEAKD
ncbi:MAG: hypothetical protein Q7S21_02460 [archaeon]|nr:hypothetical protein [archaeon]